MLYFSLYNLWNNLHTYLDRAQKLYKYNHPNIAHSLNDVGAAYEKLGYTREELKYFKEALKMSQGLYQGNHPDIAASLNNVGLVY
ncbi:tetratricopeptide repeat family protein [Rickettsia hoogstraalii str. RCCE3]|nr:tetratricopeptide repeat family protein [Rickettsia hoogstraalii str. RCCE3]